MMRQNLFESNLPMILGTKRKTFSEYVCAVARSTACLASTISMDARRRRVFAMVQRSSLGGGARKNWVFKNCRQMSVPAQRARSVSVTIKHLTRLFKL